MMADKAAPTPARRTQHQAHLRHQAATIASDIRIATGRAARWGIDVPADVHAAAVALQAWADQLQPGS
jgi:hypothetical protein